MDNSEFDHLVAVQRRMMEAIERARRAGEALRAVGIVIAVVTALSGVGWFAYFLSEGTAPQAGDIAALAGLTLSGLLGYGTFAGAGAFLSVQASRLELDAAGDAGP